MVKQINLVPRQERTLLIVSLTSLRYPVGVPTSPMQQIRLPPIVMCVKLGLLFVGKRFTPQNWRLFILEVGRNVIIVDEMEDVVTQNLLYLYHLRLLLLLRTFVPFQLNRRCSICLLILDACVVGDTP